MHKKRKNIIIAVIILTIFVFGAFQFVQFMRAFGVKDHRVVQILESADDKHKVELIRRYSFLDLNFFIDLDGERIYRTEDFRPNYKIPFRETILWDKTGENLILEVSRKRLFGYNVPSKRKLSEKELLALEVREPTLEELGCFSCWPNSRSD